MESMTKGGGKMTQEEILEFNEKHRAKNPENKAWGVYEDDEHDLPYIKAEENDWMDNYLGYKKAKYVLVVFCGDKETSLHTERYSPFTYRNRFQSAVSYAIEEARRFNLNLLEMQIVKLV